jgi:O-succinylbenzoic acid--CoA ligase
MEIDFLSRKCLCLSNPRMPSSELKPDVELAAHIWVATSGTTGSVKWAALSYEAILHSAEAVNGHFQVSAKDIWINPLPLFHVGGLGIQARAYLSGSAVLPLKKWDANEFYALAHKATLSALVPAQLYDLIRAGYRSPPSMRAIVIGGGALDHELFEQAIKLDWPVAPSYGMTECCSQVATAYPGENQMRILSHVELDGEPLMIRSKALLTAYWQEGRLWDPKQDGWFHTEDFVSISPPLITFRGRAGDLIKILGENVNLAALQKRFDRIAEQHNTEGCILAEKDPRRGNALILFTTADPELQALILKTFHSEVMPYERLQSVKQVAFIPRTDLGKIERAKLI